MNSVLSSDITIVPITPEHKPLIDQIVDEIARLKIENHGESFIEFSGDKEMQLFAHQDEIKGFCEIYFSGGIPYIDVYVLEKFRGQGLGPAVTIKLKQQLFDSGHSAVGLRTHKKNKRAMESAEKSGFTMIDEGVELNPDNQKNPYIEFIARNYRNTNERGYH